ncbi:TetR/AcrR family transcriptional regulator [Novosphingobium panipatense]|uniref:Transcriptional regulator, TetR family n=1 Tax=Novosphingobium panipatense TaxID=428991 RepID=A0ABY1QVE6_9SPHN|nr:TetR/AcrR family transcriptional regulator [Novosphingobium panipatense]SMP81907.1 transcriptional regulator, TetR family [Novosphingobium panipatense]
MTDSTMPKRQDARAIRSRHAMRSALLKLMAAGPFDAITGSQIAQAAGVGYSTFFRHYADVPAVLSDVVAMLTDEFTREMMPFWTSGRPEEAARVLIAAVEQRREAIRALLSAAGSSRYELSRQIIDRLSSQPDLSAQDVPHRLALRVSVAATIEVLDWWICEEPDRNAAEIAEWLRKVVLAPLAGGGMGDS